MNTIPYMVIPRNYRLSPRLNERTRKFIGDLQMELEIMAVKIAAEEAVDGTERARVEMWLGEWQGALNAVTSLSRRAL